MSEDYDVDNRYILENKSFVDTKTNKCLNFGLKDLSRVAVQLNCMERYLNNADEQIAKLQKQLEETKQTGSYQVMLMCQKENILLKQNGDVITIENQELVATINYAKNN